MGLLTFKGGIHPKDGKALAKDQPSGSGNLSSSIPGRDCDSASGRTECDAEFL